MLNRRTMTSYGKIILAATTDCVKLKLHTV